MYIIIKYCSSICCSGTTKRLSLYSTKDSTVFMLLYDTQKNTQYKSVYVIILNIHNKLIILLHQLCTNTHANIHKYNIVTVTILCFILVKCYDMNTLLCTTQINTDMPCSCEELWYEVWFIRINVPSAAWAIKGQFLLCTMCSGYGSLSYNVICDG